LTSGIRSRGELRRLIAREAAWLLYTGQVREYKTAKEMAAKALGARILPSNAEVAVELGRLMEELEGQKAEERLIKMRAEALEVMKALEPFRPRLIGSVWRGLAREDSDIDIEVFCDEPEEVLRALEGAGYRVVRHEAVVKDEPGGPVSSYHIYLRTRSGREVEVVVRPEEMEGVERRCEIFGDVIRGLSIPELEAVLREEPARKSVPGGVEVG